MSWQRSGEGERGEGDSQPAGRALAVGARMRKEEEEVEEKTLFFLGFFGPFSERLLRQWAEAEEPGEGGS